MKSPPVLSHCAEEVYVHDRDSFLLSLFLPEDKREALLALYALNVNLARIPSVVTEEMIGHIRYAWWRETLEGLYEGTLPRGQPVLEALVPVMASGYLPKERLMPLVECYAEQYPHPPTDIDPIIDAAALQLVRGICPEASAAWEKANDVVSRHHRRYGRAWRGWLSLKLLFAVG